MFGFSRAPRTFQAAAQDLKHATAQIRASAAADLAAHAEHRSEQVVDLLLETLKDEHVTVRAAAALALADVQAAESVLPLMAAAAEDEPAVRQMALTALGELRDGRAEKVVAAALSATEPAVRFQAIMAFPRVSSDRPAIIDALVAASKDDDPLVTRIALRMAEELGPQEAGDSAVVDERLLSRAAALLEHDSSLVRATAAVILGRSGRVQAKSVLVAVATRQLTPVDAEDEAAAIELCGELGIRRAVAGLKYRAFRRTLLFHHDPFAWHARVALARMGNEKAIQWVYKELSAWTRERRTLAVAAIGQARLRPARDRIVAMQEDATLADPDTVSHTLALLDRPDSSPHKTRRQESPRKTP